MGDLPAARGWVCKAVSLNHANRAATLGPADLPSALVDADGMSLLPRSETRAGTTFGAIQRATQALSAFGVAVMISITIAYSIDIVLRWFRVSSLAGLSEALSLLMAIAVTATFMGGTVNHVHIAIDIVARLLPERVERLLHDLGELLLLTFLVLLTYCLAIAAIDLGNRSATTMFLKVPEAPVIWVCVILCAATTVAQAAVLTFSLMNRRSAVRCIALALASTVIVSSALAISLVASALSKFPVAIALVAIALMMVAIFGLVPLAAAMGLVGFAAAIILMGFHPASIVLGTTAVDYLTSPYMAVLPLFLLMSGFCGVAGLSADIYRLAHALFGHRRAGLAQATILGCAGFGAISSSSIATCAAIGQIVMPEMRRRGYRMSFATGVIAAGGTLGPLLSPGSGPLVIYALLAEQSIGQLFIGSIAPAVLAILLFSLTAALVSRLDPGAAPMPEPAASWSEIGRAAFRAWGVLLIFVVIFGGIYGGIFTVPEAAAVGAGISFLFALARGQLSRGRFWDVMSQVTGSTAMLYVMFFGAMTFSYFVDYSGLPDLLTSYLEGLPLPPWLIITLFLITFVLLGCVMESYAVLLIVTPLVTPYIHDLGASLIWWGVLMVGVVETGMITPPLGLNVLVLKKYAGYDVSTGMIFRGVFPFVVADIVRLILIVAFPGLVLWLPTTMK
jgi:tripartite ATP-independent transporter DctM subunit